MAPAVVARYAAPLHCAIDGTVVFHWAAEWHDLQRFASKQHMENCDFDGAQPLGAVGDAGTTTSFYLACATPGEEIHVGCSVADHCARGQKLSIHVSHSVHALAADGSVSGNGLFASGSGREAGRPALTRRCTRPPLSRHRAHRKRASRRARTLTPMRRRRPRLRPMTSCR